MPTKNCNAERNAFLKAAQRVSDMEAALYIAQNNLIAALWESAAANIELVQQAVEAVHEGGSKVAVRVTGVLKSIASDKAAEARVKAAKASYDIALANRDKAKQDFDKAQAALLVCLAKLKRRRLWSGTLTMTTVCVEKPERHKGVMGWYGSSSKSKEVFTWTIVGPKSPIDDTMYVARWTVTSDGVEESWGKPFNERNLAGEQTTKTTQGVASGVSEMEIDYDDEKGIDIDVVAGPVAADDRLIIAERVMGAGSPSFSMVKRPLLIAGGFSHATFANGTKLKGRTVSGSKSETGDNCKTTLQWRLTDNGVH